MKLEESTVVDFDQVLEAALKIKAERDALSAVVERQREAMQKVLAISDRKHVAWDEAKAAMALTPATALAVHDAEVLERVAKDYFRGEAAALLLTEAARLRAGGEG